MKRLLFSIGFVAACGGFQEPRKAPAWHKERAVAQRPMQIVDKETADSSAIDAEDFDVPFGNGQNGTELLLGYLEMAHQKNAAYVSDLYVDMMFKWRGFPVECRSRVYLEDEAKARKVVPVALPTASKDGDGVPTYSTEVEAFRPKALAYRATDDELVCRTHLVQRLVQANNTVVSLTDDFDAEVRRPGTPPDRLAMPTSRETELVPEEVCEKHPVTRDTVRYDYQMSLGFVPVDWASVGKRYAPEKLVESEPTCYLLEKSEVAEAHHTLHGRLYYRASTGGVDLSPQHKLGEQPPSLGRDRSAGK